MNTIAKAKNPNTMRSIDNFERVIRNMVTEAVAEVLSEKIEIDPKNKGKFTATKKRTGKSTEELTHSKNPLTRKRAVFAQNARKWNHKGRKSK